MELYWFVPCFFFLEGVPWQLRSSVVEFTWVATFGVLQSSLNVCEYSMLKSHN